MLHRLARPLARPRFLPFFSVVAALAGCGDDGQTGGAGGSGASSSDGGSGGDGAGTSGGGGEGGAPDLGDYEEIECDAELTAPASGVCGVSADGESGVLLRGTVLGPGALYRNGGVLVDASGIIQCVGCDCDAGQAAVVDCPEGVISPGLINPHDHITYANNPPLPVAEGVRYDHRHEWRIGLNDKPRINYADEASTNQVLFAELRFLISGATSAASAGSADGLIRNLDSNGALEGLPIRVADSDTFPLGDASGIMNTSGCDYGSNRTEAGDIDDRDGYLPHIAEGIGVEAQNEFVCTSDGSIADGEDLIETQTSVIHAIGMRAEDFEHMQEQKATVVWSPRSNISLYGDTARVTMIDALGVPIALGTDWMPSGSMNILRELRCADELNATYYDGYFSDLQLWRMVTENAAFATGAGNAIGMLKQGYVADIAIFDARTRSDFRAVVGAGVEDVVLVMRGGRALYGDADLMSEAAIGGADCEDLSICEIDRKACVQSDVGSSTLAQVLAAGEAIYPLSFCSDETVDDEPSCVPWRPEYPDGITDDDSDADGVPNADDLCPSVFDPPRPIDGGGQADADRDGIGDACDACPLTSGEDCTAPDAVDVDGDGAMNAVDGCPELADASQADEDGDGHGDDCDACPSAPNPGPAGCATTIATVRNPNAAGHPAEGASVTVTGFVTAIRSTGGDRGFSIQDGSGPYSGLFVFTGNQTPTVAVGNEVSVTGTYDEYFGFTELASPVVTILDAGTTLPASITVQNGTSGMFSTPATAEPYESMLVSVGAVTITNQNPDGAQDFDEFTVTSAASTGLRVDDYFFGALDNMCPVTTSTFTGITGVLVFSFDNFKLAPRTADDVDFVTCQPYP